MSALTDRQIHLLVRLSAMETRAPGGWVSSYDLALDVCDTGLWASGDEFAADIELLHKSGQVERRVDVSSRLRSASLLRTVRS